ncbi:MAG: PIG-L family deacetylase [Armatimonadota bacterium]
MNEKQKKTLKIMLLILLVFIFLFNSYFLIPGKYRKTAEKYLESAVYFPSDLLSFYGKTIVVFAPHCDDEVLGCGGLIKKAVSAGAKVHIVLITNGEGFKYAVEAKFLKVTPSVENYIDFARIRQKESLSALKHLGIDPKNIFFLGYPDRGIARMWETNWGRDNPFYSPYTKNYSSLYENSFTKNTPYSGEALFSDIEKILKITGPDIIYIPHTMDAHPDHWAANCFITAAVEKEKHGKKPRVLAYLVHRGNWPYPSGIHTSLALIPPKILQKTGTQWEILPLGELVAREKLAAIKEYKTQLLFMKNYLFSFARKNEVFGAYPGVKIKNMETNMTGEIVIKNPSGDTMKKKTEKDCAIDKICAYKYNGNLYITVKTVKNISGKTRITLFLTLFYGENKLKRKEITYDCGMRENNDALKRFTVLRNKNMATFIIPLKQINNPRKIFLGAKSYNGKSLVDRTSYRMLILE